MQKLLKIGILILGLVMLETFTGACATIAMWQHSNNPVYTEKVNSFQITGDGKQLLVLGEKYHYIFKVSPSLKNILESPVRPSLKATFYRFHVTEENEVKGNYSLRLPSNATDEEKHQAVAAGLKPVGQHGGHVFAEEIHGIRYSAADFKHPENTSQFNKTYVITASEPKNAADVAGKLLLTPVTLAVDGALIYAGAVLVAVILPVALISDAARQGSSTRPASAQ